jgi:hypothetical protein
MIYGFGGANAPAVTEAPPKKPKLNNAHNTSAQSTNHGASICPPPRPPSLAGTSRPPGAYSTTLDLDTLEARAPTAPAHFTSLYTTQARRPVVPTSMREDGGSEVGVWLICCPCALALWIRGPEKGGRRWRGYEWGDESDGDGDAKEKGKCQDEDGAEAEGG